MQEIRSPLPLNALRAFAVASRHRSFTAAAHELGVTQVAVSRHIAVLENFLGVQLYERGHRSARLTEIGRSFGHEIAGLFDDLEARTVQLLDAESRNAVQVRVYPSFAYYWLMPRQLSFHELYPDVRVRLDTRVGPLDFRGTQLDVAIQLGNGMWRDAQARKLFDEVIDVVQAPHYADPDHSLVTPADVRGHVLLHSRYRRRAWDQWAAAQNLALDGTRGQDFDSSLLTYSAAANGLGLAVGQIELLRQELVAGRLVCPFERPVETGQAFYIVWPTTVSVSPSTRRFIDWMLHECGKPHEFFRKAS